VVRMRHRRGLFAGACPWATLIFAKKTRITRDRNTRFMETPLLLPRRFLVRLHRRTCPFATGMEEMETLSARHTRNGALNNRAGKSTTAHTRASAPCTAIPTTRNGKSSNQIKG